MQIPKAPIVKVHIVEHLNGSRTPARCNRRTGDIWINKEHTKGMKPEHLFFILLHELAHIKLNSSDELEVDKWASEQYVKCGYALTSSVQSLSSILTGDCEEHVERVKAQLDRATTIDNQYNKPKNQNHIMNFDSDLTHEYLGFDEVGQPQNHFDNLSFYGRFDDAETNDLFGMVKHMKAKRALKLKKKEGKIDIQSAKAYAIRNKSDSVMELAKQGIQYENGGQKALATVGKVVGGIFGKGGNNETMSEEITQTTSPTAPAPTEPKSNKKTMMIVGIVVGVLAIGGVLFFVLRPKK